MVTLGHDRNCPTGACQRFVVTRFLPADIQERGKIARVAVARKLLEIICRIWKEEKPYYKKGTVALHVV